MEPEMIRISSAANAAVRSDGQSRVAGSRTRKTLNRIPAKKNTTAKSRAAVVRQSAAVRETAASTKLPVMCPVNVFARTKPAASPNPPTNARLKESHSFGASPGEFMAPPIESRGRAGRRSGKLRSQVFCLRHMRASEFGDQRFVPPRAVNGGPIQPRRKAERKPILCHRETGLPIADRLFEFAEPGAQSLIFQRGFARALGIGQVPLRELDPAL